MTTYEGSDILVSTEWLAENLENPNFVLIDAGEADAYRRAHICLLYTSDAADE